MYEICAMVDTNDADYEYGVNPATQEDIDRLIPIIEVIKLKGNSHNWENDHSAEDIQRELYPNLSVDDIEFLMEFLPWPEYGFHTIKSIEYYLKPEKIRLL